MNLPRFTATAVGSFPHTDPDAALDIIFRALPAAPLWPQLPRAALTEQMEIQYAEGIPGAVLDEARQRLTFDTAGDPSEALAAFYEVYLAAAEAGPGEADLAPLAIGPSFARGLHRFAARLAADGVRRPLVKVQTTGPLSFALTVVDQDKRAIYYDETFRDVIVKALALKCRWQIRTFAPWAERVLCFIDEPILAAFGSSTYISVTRGDVTSLIGEMVDAIHAEGGLAGVHCCGNTDWSLLVEAGADVINFDAFGYGESIALYPEALRTFLDRGGLLAWGIVPTSERVREQTATSLADRFDKLVRTIAGLAGLDRARLAETALLTPSCGTGSLSLEDAGRVFDLLAELPAVLTDRYGAGDIRIQERA